MRTVTSLAEAVHQTAAARARGDRVGLVPTRGDLHDGHAALVRTAHAQCDVVLLSIVRPDGTPAYHEAADERVASDAGADLLWRPHPGPLVAATTVQVVPTDQPALAQLATADVQQIGHLRPDVVYVGDDHYDHARLLLDVVRDLALAVEVRVVPTPRDPGGLPASAAARAVSADDREAALHLPLALDAVVDAVASGEQSLFRLRARAESVLAQAPRSLVVEDVATVDATTHRATDSFAGAVRIVVRVTVGGHELVDSRLLEPAADGATLEPTPS